MDGNHKKYHKKLLLDSTQKLLCAESSDLRPALSLLKRETSSVNTRYSCPVWQPPATCGCVSLN